MYVKFCCALLRIKKVFGIYREPITTTKTATTRVAFWDPPSGSKNPEKLTRKQSKYAHTLLGSLLFEIRSVEKLLISTVLIA